MITAITVCLWVSGVSLALFILFYVLTIVVGSKFEGWVKCIPFVVCVLITFWICLLASAIAGVLGIVNSFM